MMFVLRCVAVFAVSSSMVFAQGTVAPEEAPPSVAPSEAVKLFDVAGEMAISLVVSEPDVAQPLSMTFDDRGRLWVLQYLQFPIPEGLKAVEIDNWLRTKYDRIPEPPPRGPKGNDRITIYEDADGDGGMEVVTHFLTDLNLASGMALGYDGVFVVQPPYLLFYADKNRDDVPDGDPEVLLQGFGMEDAHAFANSLTWGPDGWLYGVQGSTATAEIRGIGFQQGIWRYHPRTKEFELFAEGGGNSWGLDFDEYGNAFAAGNTVEPLVHHVQGAYYVKGFGKHGPLHNPHAYGYFQPVLHHGYTGDSLTGGYVLYRGGAFPPEFNGAVLAPNTRHSCMRYSTLEKRGSTFATRAVGDFVTTSDLWFRPVDSIVGPDGALYIADWYDYNISHSSPKNRTEWYQPSKSDGRIWRVAPQGTPRIALGEIDLSSLTNVELIELYSHPNNWYRREARRILAERRDGRATPELLPLLDSNDEVQALQGLWSIYVSGGFDDYLAVTLLYHPHEYVRAWMVRFLGDEKKVSDDIALHLIQLAADEESVIVRSQLACSAKRLPANVGLKIVRELLLHSEDVDDPHVPLLIWWAIEDKAISDTWLTLELLSSPEQWRLPLVKQFITERLARRFAADDSKTGYDACARLLEHAPGDAEIDQVLAGMQAAFSGRRFESIPGPLAATLPPILARKSADPVALQLGLRMNASADAAIAFVSDATKSADNRVTIVRTLGETRTGAAIPVLLELASGDESGPVTSAAFAALPSFDDESIADTVLMKLPMLAADSRSQAIDVLCSRLEWTRKLLTAVAAKEIDVKEVTVDQVRRILSHADDDVQTAATDLWGRIQAATPLEKQGRIRAIHEALGRKAGDPAAGRLLFEKTCANCHKLHGKGNAVGPDLTGAERKDIAKLVDNIVDPSAVIRPEFITHVAVTTDGRVLTGLLADSTPETITLLDAKNMRTVLNRADIDELQESPTSIMPEKLLDELTDQQIRDLLAFIRTDG